MIISVIHGFGLDRRERPFERPDEALEFVVYLRSVQEPDIKIMGPDGEPMTFGQLESIGKPISDYLNARRA